MRAFILKRILERVTGFNILKLGVGNNELYSFLTVNGKYYKTIPKKGILIKYVKAIIKR